jgi:hypothetical protein
MPWKIHTAEFLGRRPCLHMVDHSVNLHLVTDLGSGVIDLYIGHIEPSQANLHLTIDVDRVPIVVLERVSRFASKQVAIIDNVLTTMGLADSTRRALLQPARHASR